MPTSLPPNKRRIALLGAPTDVGAADRGGSMGPEALRVAQIEATLRRLDREVVDLGNVSGPSNPQLPPTKGLRHLREVVDWNAAIRDALYFALNDGDFPILMGGDHSLAIGSLAAVSRFCREMGRHLTVIWLDAHADFNTSETSPSGNIHGMPVAVASGYGPDELTGLGDKTPMIEPEQMIQIGLRSVDAREKVLVGDAGVHAFDMRAIDEVGIRKVMERAIELASRQGGHVHVSFDVDFLDPSIAPGVGTTVQGGPNYREAQLCMEMLSDCGLVGSLDIMELNPAFDHKNRTAEVAIELVESLFGAKTLARAPKLD